MNSRNRGLGRLPEKYQKRFVLGSVFAVIGTGFGIYFALRFGNYFYAGIGAGIGSLIGAILGELVGLLVHEKLALTPLVRTYRILSIGIAILNLLLAFVAIVHFYASHHWSGLVGALFFGIIGVMLILRKQS